MLGTYPGESGGFCGRWHSVSKVPGQLRQRGEGDKVAGGAGQGARHEMRLEGAGARVWGTGGVTEVLLVATPSGVSAVVTGPQEATSMDECRSWHMWQVRGELL